VLLSLVAHAPRYQHPFRALHLRQLRRSLTQSKGGFPIVVKLSIGLGMTLAILAWAAQAVVPPAPQDHVIIGEETWLPLAAESADEFEEARQAFINEDYMEAALHLRKGVAFMKVEAGRADGENKSRLISSIKEVSTLAEEIEKRRMNSLGGLDTAIARAEYALAAHYRILMDQAYAEENAKYVMHHMQAIASHLEHALLWAGHEGERVVTDAVNLARRVAAKMMEASGWAGAETGKAFTALGDAIEKAGQWVEPREQ
jgi:hypothetical protein